jgi:hypothetical protein
MNRAHFKRGQQPTSEETIPSCLLCKKLSYHLYQKAMYIYIPDFFKLLQSLNFLFIYRGQILQHLLHCNAKVGGWESPQYSFYFLCIFLLGNRTIFCKIELFAIKLICVLYNLDILCTILLRFVRICTLLRI